jgi:hypothetical protein
MGPRNLFRLKSWGAVKDSRYYKTVYKLDFLLLVLRVNIILANGFVRFPIRNASSGSVLVCGFRVRLALLVPKPGHQQTE